MAISIVMRSGTGSSNASAHTILSMKVRLNSAELATPKALLSALVVYASNLKEYV